MPPSNKLEIAPQAREQLLELTAYTRKTFGASQAKKLSNDFRQLFRQLAAFPSSRRVDPNLPPLRRAVLPPFIILYDILNNGVRIVRIRHGARDPDWPRL